jgi:hypothetical protein
MKTFAEYLKDNYKNLNPDNGTHEIETMSKIIYVDLCLDDLENIWNYQQKEISNLEYINKTLKEKAERLEKENEKLKETVEFYGTFEKRPTGYVNAFAPCRVIKEDVEEIAHEGVNYLVTGKLARKTLKELNKG